MPSGPSTDVDLALAERGRRSEAGWPTKAGLLFSVSACIFLAFLILFAPLQREIIGGLVILMTVGLLLMGIHVAIAILLPGLLGAFSLASASAAQGMIMEIPFRAVATWQYSVIPFFILMGMALWRSGVSAKAFAAARQWLGHVPGGLATSTVVTGGGLAAASGSSIGISYALGRVSLPEMLRARYEPGLAIGAVAVAGILGQIIPPSIMLVIYAGIVETSVGQQLLAGVGPGLLLIAAFSVMLALRAHFTPEVAPRQVMTDVTWSTRMRSLLSATPLLAILAIVIGGMLTGFFTATEAGAVGALVAVVVGAFSLPQHERNVRGVLAFLYDAGKGAVHSSASIFFLLIGVFLLARVVAISQLPQSLAGVITAWGLGALGLALLLIPFYLILGMFLDTISIVLVTVPVLLPTLISLDIDLLWFGVYVIILAEMAMITPPLGMLTFIVHRLAVEAAGPDRAVSLVTAFKGVGWYIVAVVVVVLMLIAWPEIALWLPNASGVRG